MAEPRRFAENTQVPVSRSQEEIRRLCLAHGATAVGFAEDSLSLSALVQFVIQNRMVQIRIPMPDPNDKKFTHLDKWRERGKGVATKLWEQAVRQRWRAALLLIKAKLEAVAGGVQTFEAEFLPYLKIPGQAGTVADVVVPQIRAAYDGRGSGPLLLLPPPKPPRPRDDGGETIEGEVL